MKPTTDLDQALTNIADSLEAHGLTQSTIGTRECIGLADYLRRCAAYAYRLQVTAGAWRDRRLAKLIRGIER